MKPLIKIGTRKSKLALWQAEYVSTLLQKVGFGTELVTMETIGDKIQNVSISKIGSKGVFTEEIESLLLNGAIDIAVHSAKDLQSTLEEPFEIIAYTKREQVNDVLISENKSLKLNPDADFKIGTSSTRRVALLKKYFPNIKTTPTRGNLQTRLKKMNDGESDALLLAFAGVKRMNYSDKIIETIDKNLFVPAVGQGSIAIEAVKNLSSELKAKIRQALNHKETEICLTTERSFLKTINGGCSIPVYGLAEIVNNKLGFSAGVISLDGKKEIRRNKTDKIQEAKNLGKLLAEEILESGGAEILKEIRLNL